MQMKVLVWYCHRLFSAKGTRLMPSGSAALPANESSMASPTHTKWNVYLNPSQYGSKPMTQREIVWASVSYSLIGFW
jgi:hypothetical protein